MGAAVERLWEEVREVSYGRRGEVERLNCAPTPLHFYREFVSSNKPCIISNAVHQWPALNLWPDDTYFTNSIPLHSSISLHLTPNGRADSLVPHPTDSSLLCFASPHVLRLPFPDALRLIAESKIGSCVAYAQEQNDCLRREYSGLVADCHPDLPWATEALGCLPDAVNIWIGNHLSETSFHKDHYENLYVVVSGEKHFILFPPSDVHRMYIRDYPAARYVYSQDGLFTLEMESPERNVPWCSVEPHPSAETWHEKASAYPLFFSGPKPFICTVKAGEILYLPSMWFHHVRQSPDDTGRTIAVNYWYDMKFDIKYAYFNFLSSVPLDCSHSDYTHSHSDDEESDSKYDT